MLEYRHFPLKKALTYLMFSPVFAYFIYSIQEILFNQTSPVPSLDLSYVLFLGVIVAFVSLAIAGYVVDRIHRTYTICFATAVIPITLDLVRTFLPIVSSSQAYIEVLFVFALFSGFSVVTLSWSIMVNRTVVLRYRGRLSASMFALALVLFLIFNIVGSTPVGATPFAIELAHILVPVGLLISLLIRPWRWQSYPLAVSGNPTKYFIPMTLLLLAHFLWYHGTMMSIQGLFRTVGEANFSSLGEYAGWTQYEPLIVAIGAMGAGFLADLRGRKPAFNTLVLSMGLLAIFSSTMYGIESSGGQGSARVILQAWPLLLMERLVEGFLLGLCIFLIWAELGSPKTKGLRLSSILVVLSGYFALFWVIQAGPFALQLPGLVALVGPQIAVLLTLVALYTTSDAPELRGREVEMEELSLDFSEKMVKETVEAFVEDEDLDSIRSQVDLIDVGTEISDQDFREIIGEDFNDIVSFRDIKGIGPAMEKKLRAAGYTSAAQLAGEIPSRLSRRVEGIGEERAEKILEAAREVVKSALKNNGEK
ncbi:helix-hairpin-helix domain-containing protein [Candidatus Thorarchaeota archaeon]|nr:MAG: helix-hairpin-helix domain-containing protein [Candidatus Thorarchaeota archaeon]